MPVTLEKNEFQILLNRAKQMAAEAEQYGSGKCIMGEAVYWIEYDRPLYPGHIYTPSGRKEFGISRMCEYHFDKTCLTKEQFKQLQETGSYDEGFYE